ncbi:MAG: iron complex outermembrane receptor protein [Pseudohongiellaceae bacterium]|jgi:iron complex outermembrane receptor protein
MGYYMKKDKALLAFRPCASLTLASAVALASTLSSLPVLAQDNALILEEIIVTARKRNESLQEVPVAVTALTTELAKSSIRNLRDIEGYSPNVTIDTSGAGPGAAAISIRGVSYQEVDKSLDPSVGVIIDGIYMGTNVGQILNNFDIAQIEILRGPQGTLFGKNTTGGVINVVRNKPTGEFGGEIRAAFGSWDLQDYKGLVNFSIIEDKLAAKIYATHASDDGWLKNTTINEDTARIDSKSYGFSLLATPTEDFEALFSYDRLEDDSDIVGGHNFNKDESLICSLAGLLGDTGFGIVPNFNENDTCASLDTGSDKDSVSMNDHQNASVETDAYTLNMQWDVGPGVITAITGYRENVEFRRAEYDVSSADFFTLYFDQDYEQFSQEINFTSTFSEKFEFVAGVYYWDSEYSQQSETVGLIFNTFILGKPPGTSGFLRQNQKTESTAVYFQGDWHISDALTATLGMRYTKEEKDFEATTTEDQINGVVTVAGQNAQASDEWSETTPKIGLSYKLDDDILLFASYAQGFKSGGFFGRNTTVDTLEATYDPEYVNTYELGMKSDWLDGRVRFNATAFYTEYDDKQEDNLVPLPDLTVATIISNAASVEMAGLELELVAALTEKIRLQASYGYIDAEYKDYVADINGEAFPGEGEILTDNSYLSLRRTPENTFGLSTTYTDNFGEVGFTGDISYRWRDVVETIADNDPIGQVDSFGMWSASADFTISEQFKISVYGRNLTDERHADAVINIGPLTSTGTYNRPRNWGAELSYTF